MDTFPTNEKDAIIKAQRDQIAALTEACAKLKQENRELHLENTRLKRDIEAIYRAQNG